MSELINLTIVNSDEIIRVSLIEETPITVSFFNIAFPDPRVTQALQGAQEAQAASEAVFQEVLNVQNNINDIIEEAVVEVASSSIVNALIFG